jgi:hypothetical protein
MTSVASVAPLGALWSEQRNQDADVRGAPSGRTIVAGLRTEAGDAIEAVVAANDIMQSR